MIRKLDLAKARAHRRAEAKAGMPLLRGCPNTAAFTLIRHFDSLETSQQLAFADQVSDLDEKQAISPGLMMEERAAFLRTLPLLAGLYGQTAPQSSAGTRVIAVKLFAGLMKDVTSAATQTERDNARLVAQTQHPVAGHAASLDELVPVSPRRLRKLIGDMMSERFGADAMAIGSDHTRYRGAIGDHPATMDIMFASSGGRPMHQFDHVLSLTHTDGTRINALSYEGIWLIPARWDYITEANADRSVAHFGRALDAVAELV